jgi:amino acid adenylation domain-containing protein
METPLFPSLIELLRVRSQGQGERLVYTFLADGEEEEARLTYRELDVRARAIGAALQAAGLQGERALLLFPPGLDFVAAFWGCLYAGTVAVPAYPPKPNQPDPRILAIARDARPRAVLSTAAALPRLRSLAERFPELSALSWIATDATPAGSEEEWRHPGSDAATLAFLQYTSGSTSLPKGVMVSHGNLLHNEEMIRRAFGQSPETVVVGWLPLYHDMGLIGNVLQPLYAGGSCVLMSPLAFLQRPLRWLAAIDRYRGTTSGGPNFAYELCVRKIGPEQRAALDLSSWRVAYSGAEPVRAETLDRFAEAFAASGFRREAFFPCYGLAEATLFVTGGALEAPPVVEGFGRSGLETGRVEPLAAGGPAARPLVGCGSAWLEQDLVIADPASGEECPPERVGEIWVAGPSVAGGYWGRPEPTAVTFLARLTGQAGQEDRGPFLRTGDLGFLRGGQLFITGRLKDLIILRGRNHYPEDLEVAAERAHPALRPGCTAAFAVEADGEERLVVVLEADRRAGADPREVLDAVRQAVAGTHEVQVHEVLLVRPGTVPKTSSGKVQRHACRTAYVQGSLEVVARSGAAAEEDAAEDAGTPLSREALAALPAEEGLRALVALIRREAARAARVSLAHVDPERPLSGLDSLAALELRHAVEALLGVSLPLVDLLAGATPAQLAADLLTAVAGLGEGGEGEPLRPAAEPPAEFPLSHGQRALWFLERLAPEGAAYNIAAAGRVLSGLDAGALRRAVEELAILHPSLRTTFEAPQGEPIQRVHARLDPDFSIEDAAGWSDEQVDERLHALAFRPFDLQRGPLFRVAVLERGEEAPVVLFAIHHLIADFWSLGMLARQLGLLYAHAGEPAAPALAYSDFVAWQHRRLEGAEGERLWSWWRERLAGPLPDLDLPTDRPRPPVQTHRGGSVRRRIDPERAGDVRSLARSEGATLHGALLAAFQVLLHRHTGQSVLQVGSPVTGRTRAELAGVVGYLVNVVVHRAALGEDPGFAGHLRRVHAEALGALEHQDFPFPLLAERLQPARDPSRSPLFQALFSLQGAHFSGGESLAALALGEPGARAELGGLVLAPLPLDRRPAQLDLALEVTELDGGFALALRFNADLFDASTAERLLGRFAALLDGAVADPAARVGVLPVLTAAERAQIEADFNATAHPLPAEWGLSIHGLVEAQAARTPDAVAVERAEDPQDSLTFRELESRANQLAHHLLRLGVRPEEPVAVCTERSPSMLVALLGVLKTGAAYLPLDPAYPRDRLAYMLEDAGVGTVLTQESLERLVPRPGDMRALRLDADWERVARESAEPLAVFPGGTAGGESLAYTIYTSGSTGRPKGVQVRHGGVVHFLAAMSRAPGIAADDVLLSVTTLSFDIAVLELFLPLAVGARVVLASRETAADGARLATALERCGATVMQATPATWRLLVESGWRGAPGLRILCGGEALPRQLADALLPRGASLWNLYGPTETTIWSAVTRVAPGEGPVPIGRPIDNTRLAIVGRGIEAVPVGVAGELLIGGAGVARGYHRRPDLTADRFVPDPWGAPGDRLYRTGDLARWLPDGTVQFLGRVDHQVKVRGHRVELGEIEACLAAHPAVREAVVLAREDRPGDVRLVGYLIPELIPDGLLPAGPELRAFLRERLPEPVVPGLYVSLEAWPLTPNGKVDRKALPPPAGTAPQAQDTEPRREDAAPRSALERRIAGIWREVLGVDRVGARDNFFDLGGHSLLLGRVHARLRDELGLDVSMVDLLRHSTVASLAAFLRDEHGDKAAPGRRSRRPDGESGDVALIGLSGRFPGAGDVESFWRNLRDGVESITPFADEELRAAGADAALLADPAYVKAGAVVDGVEMFDAGFFGFTPREAETLDPQHRLFLECAWEAMERAGYDPGRVPGAVGVYAGVGLNAYLLNNLKGNRAFLDAVGSYQAFISNDKDFVPTRVSYKLDLKGPSVNVQTACSSSLVAVHLARQALLAGECNMALAGGVSLAVPHRIGYLHQEGGILSPDGHCRPFDATARGTVRGNGAGVVLLKRLEDALADGDRIRAVIKGSAINNDGSGKVGYTAPSVDGQARVLQAALADARVEPGSIGYVEAHGTGTELGDPVEVAALTQAWRAAGEERSGVCALGSVKSNIGHLDTAAGVAGLIKAALAVERGEIPPTLHFTRPNPRIDFAASPFVPAAALRAWPQDEPGPRRAGVSSFGIGGTNVHVILEEPPALGLSDPPRPWQLLPLSARTETALDAVCRNLAAALRSGSEDPAHLAAHFADIAWTLQVGRKPFPVRRLLVAESAAEAAAALETLDPERLISGTHEGGESSAVFLFSGQGSQHPGMARQLYDAEPEFRTRIDEACEILRPHLGIDLREVIWPAAEVQAEEAARRLERTSLAQPALFVIEHALARLWMSWGVRPAAFLGHSVGELVAACLAGVFRLEDALALVAERGRLMEAMPEGAMLAVPLPEAEVVPLLDGGLALAAVNAPAACTVAGSEEAVAALEARLAARGVEGRRLRVSHAFHSSLMDAAVEPFVRRVAAVHREAPRVPFISNLTGTWITDEEATDPAYWGRHLRGTVRFAAGVAELLREPGHVLLEVGPGQALATLARQHPARGTVVATSRHPRDPRPDRAVLLEALGRLWMAGVPVDWDGVRRGERRLRVELPTYPFERQRHWVEPVQETAYVRPRRPAGPGGWLWAPFWRESAPPASTLPSGGRWLVLADDCGVGEALAGRLESAGHPAVLARELPPDAAAWDALLAMASPTEIVYTRTVTGPAEPDLSALEDRAFHDLVTLGQALGRRPAAGPLRLTVVSDGLHRLPGDRAPRPEKALLFGPCRVLPQEIPGVRCRSVDLSVLDVEGAVETILAELSTAASEDVVAWRGDDRWVPEHEPVEPAVGEPRLRERGVYLITGGTGGIGLTLAERLAERVRARLVLVSRRGTADPAVIARLEAHGAEVMVAAADVADAGALTGVIASARERFGASLSGVIHAAGVPGGGIVQLKTREAAARVLAPKVRGTLALASALTETREAPDFVLLCSSINATLGGFGQVDYCAANAFLDSFARARSSRRGTLWVSVGWDRWSEVGMAVDAARGAGARSSEAVHPLLDRCLAATPERAVYATELSPERHWVLSEHLILGRPTIPGTTYLEMARAACELTAGAGPVEIRDAVFLTPLVVDAGSRAEVLTILEKGAPEEEGFAFRVVSRAAGASQEAWTEHSRGRVGRTALETAENEPEPVDPRAVAARCPEDLAAAGAAHARGLEGFLTTGPRWASLLSMRAGEEESLATLELDAAFAAEIQTFGLYPALLDVAAGSVQLRTDANYLPLAYERLVARAPLPPRFHSHARYRGEAGDTITCDLALLDEAGRELVAITGFSMRRIGDDALAQLKNLTGISGAGIARAAEPSAFQGLIAGRYGDAGGGIAPAQGADLFERLLAGSLPQVVISIRDLTEALAEARSFDTERLVRELAAAAPAAGALPLRQRAQGSFVAPGDELEARVARVWQRVLGIDGIGIHDNFFELGGTSLTGIQLVAELKKEIGVEIPSVSIFEAPTVSALARRLRPREEGAPAAFDHSRERARQKRAGLAQRQMEALQARRRRTS